MKTRNQIALAIAATLFAGSISAASLDFREEYKHDSEDWAGRIKIGGNTGNHFYGVEMKHTGNLSELQRGDSEFEYGYNFKLDDNWRITTSMPITFGNEAVTYKPQVRVQYKFDSGITTKLRYRHEFRNYADGKTSTGLDGQQHDSLNAGKITGNIEYNWNAWQFGLEGNYKEDFFSDEWKLGNRDGKYEWDYNMKIGYKAEGWDWRPYVEFGNVQCNSSCDDSSSRQLRSRIGVTYSF
ncbi:oligogalacturonate-specific porin KdgM family protein [Vibrio sp. TBV020]|uniref:oligogalacturonate-specific porin KdgM family protein n=1 Tax=Vibrio sp. TBV020 TaxID=3137398 RepID=UPI0038CD1CDD